MTFGTEKKLTTDKEFELLMQSTEELNLIEVRELIERTRRIRDKYQNLVRGQVRNGKEKRASLRTVEKFEIFQGVLSRLCEVARASTVRLATIRVKH